MQICKFIFGYNILKIKMHRNCTCIESNPSVHKIVY